MAQQAGSQSLVYGVDFSVQHTSAATECFSYQGQDWQFEELYLGLRGPFQRDNAATALATLECLQARFPVSPTQLRDGLLSAVWPGRFQIVSDSPLVILDGAHNPQAIAALVDALPSVLHGRRVTLLFGVMQDKDWRVMLPALAHIADEVVVTQVQNGRAEDPHLVQEVFSAWCPTRVISDARTACQSLVKELGADTALVVCGSLFLVAEVIALFPAALVPSVEGVESDASVAPPQENGGRNVG
jgi:dihydrofolate synthase/folylpolyglutamate synthase